MNSGLSKTRNCGQVHGPMPLPRIRETRNTTPMNPPLWAGCSFYLARISGAHWRTRRLLTSVRRTPDFTSHDLPARRRRNPWDRAIRPSPRLRHLTPLVLVEFALSHANVLRSDLDQIVRAMYSIQRSSDMIVCGVRRTARSEFDERMLVRCLALQMFTSRSVSRRSCRRSYLHRLRTAGNEQDTALFGVRQAVRCRGARLGGDQRAKAFAGNLSTMLGVSAKQGVERARATGFGDE